MKNNTVLFITSLLIVKKKKKKKIFIEQIKKRVKYETSFLNDI